MLELTRPRGLLTLGVTPGCPAGVGPELIARAIGELAEEGVLTATSRLRFFASAKLLLEGCRRAGVDAVRERSASEQAPGERVTIAGVAVVCEVDDDKDPGAGAAPGVVTDDAIACQRDALLRAIVSAARGDVHALVTGPVRKAALVVHGTAYPGQTELVHKTLHDDDGPPLMVFMGAPFILGLHTVHVSLSAVSSLITADGLARSVRRLAEAATALVGVARPRVVVLGANPHAGEGGLFGREEEDVMRPCLRALRDEGLDVSDPVPADGFFADVARHKRGVATMRGAHAVLAMHHDQGLAPYKLLCGGNGVNVTWGLRVPRTSPDHGTADALAGTGRADGASTKAAIRAALMLARRT
jgi:4-hydroxythreonine-4-phosphate dehydrogenase